MSTGNVIHPPGENPPGAAPGKKPFVVMAKPAGPACNLNCSYCYYLEKEQLFASPHHFHMPDSLLEAYIRQYLDASPGPVVLFIWHGGEPTLAGIDFYRRAVKLQKKYLPPGWECWNNLQTNGILLNDEWCKFLSEAKFDVGLSIDGTSWLHDAARKDLAGNGTYARAVESVKRLKAHGIQPDLLCVVTAAIAREPLAVYRALRNLNTGWMQFIPVVNRSPAGDITPDSVSGEAYGRFLITVFDEWLCHDIGKLEVQFFAEIQLLLNGGETSLCWMAPECGRVPVVEHDGSVYACDHYVDSAHRLGDIETSTLGEMIDLPSRIEFGDVKKTGLPKDCVTCPWLGFCHGGCPKDRFALSREGNPGVNYLCVGLRRFYAHAVKPLTQLATCKKQGMKPEYIMETFRRALAARWKGIGRNDPCPCGSGLKAKFCCWNQRT